MRRLLADPHCSSSLLPGSASGGWEWPVSGEVITSYRNGTDPYASGQHRGIDIAAPVGAAVRAAAGGEVRFAGTAGLVGADGQRPHGRRLRHLVPAPVLGVRTRGHAGGRGRPAGRRRHHGHPLGRRAAPALRRPRRAASRHAYHDPLRFLPPPPAASRPPAAPPAPAPSRRRRHPRRHRRPCPARRPARATRRARHRSAAERRARHRSAAACPGRHPSGGAAPRRAPVAQRAPRRGAVRRAGSTRPGGRSRAPSNALTVSERATPALAGGRIARAEGAHVPRPAGDHGPNLGWALACAGLLLAAGVLGLTEDGRRGTRRTRARLAGALRPLLGRR